MVTDRDIYFFDLNGYLLLEQALSAAEVAALNACIDAFPRLQPGEWHGSTCMRTTTGRTTG